MSNTKELRDRTGRLIGRITVASASREEIRDATGRLRGHYNPQTNETRDATGRLLGKGNLLVSLLG